jgi:glycosyltransferase EpsE
MPKVSIIMGIYNCEKYLSDSIDSILKQTFKDWELILCDDGSVDGTYSVAKSYQNDYPEKIVLLTNKKNKGLNYTLNKCIHYARGRYIARQDGDDRSLPNRFEEEVKFLDKHPEYALVDGNMEMFDENGVWGRTSFHGEVKKNDFAKGSPFIHPCIMMRRDALVSVGGYSEGKNLIRVEDYHLWFKFYIKGYKGAHIDDILYCYRDDRDAFAKRTVQNRVNLFYLENWGFKKLGIYKKYWYVPCKQLLMILIPNGMYAAIHRKKWEKK